MNNSSSFCFYGISSNPQSAQLSQTDPNQSSVPRSRIIKKGRSPPLSASSYPQLQHQYINRHQQNHQNPTAHHQSTLVSETNQIGSTKRTSEHLQHGDDLWRNRFDTESARPEYNQHYQAPLLIPEDESENNIYATTSGSKLTRLDNSNLDPALQNNSLGPSGGGDGDNDRRNLIKISGNDLSVKFKHEHNELGLNWKIKLDGHYRVDNFTILHKNLGEVQFLGTVDLSELTPNRPIDIASFVTFTHGCLKVADGPGYALQKVPMRIIFHDITRSDIIEQSDLKEVEGIITPEELNKMAQKLGKAMGAIFSEYIEDTKIWTLIIPPIDART